MLLTTFICLSGLLLGQAGASEDRDGADDDLNLHVSSLVRRLDDDELAERVAAEKELTELGPRVLDLLPEVTSSTSAEVKERLGRIRQALETAAAEAAAKPSLVTLKGKMSLAEALVALEQQTGNQVADFRNREGTVDVDFHDTPYWQALDVILDQVGLTINPYGGVSGQLSLTAAPPGVKRADHAVYSGIFRFEPIQITSVRDLRNPAVNSMRIRMEVAWEPRTAPISLGLPISSIDMRDANDQRIGEPEQSYELEALVQAEIPTTEFDIPLPLLSRNVKKISSLKGTMMAMIPGREETFEFARLDKADDVRQRKAGATVTLQRVRNNLAVQELRMRIAFENAENALESHRSWIYNNETYLIDGEGNRHEYAAFETTLQLEDEYGFAYMFDVSEDEIPKCKWVYKTPAAIVKLPVEFELKDIELP